MSPEELAKLLGVPDPKTAGPVGPAVVREAWSTPDKTKSDTVFRHDKWTLSQGERLKTVEDDGKVLVDLTKEAAADLYLAYFGHDPEWETDCGVPVREAFLKGLTESDDFQKTKTHTLWDDLASESAMKWAAVLYDRFEKEVEKAAQDSGKKAKPGAKQPKPKDAADAYAAGAQAATEAKKVADEIRDQAEAFNGPAPGDGSQPPGGQDPIESAKVLKKARRDPGLKKIAELAGRFRLSISGARRRRATTGPEDLIGIGPTGDVTKVVPVELALLRSPRRYVRLYALARLARGQATGLLRKSPAKKNRGPLVVVLDESGSMTPIQYESKGVALALAHWAVSQGRWSSLVAFTGGTTLGQNLRHVVLKPGAWNPSAVMNWCSHFFSGGTRMDCPLAELPDLWEREDFPPDADVVFVTDAELSPLDDPYTKFNDWRREKKVGAYGLVVSNFTHGIPIMGKFCDRVWHVTPGAFAPGAEPTENLFEGL